MSEIISRRELLKRAGMVGAGAVVPPIAGSSRSLPMASPDSAVEAAAAPAAKEPLEALTAAEADILEAVTARLIPTDANGPGATEARAARYIDRALAGFLSSSRDAYTSGLAALDAFARSSKGGPFPKLSAADQNEILRAVEQGKAPGFTPSSAAFFSLVREHTIQGTFCDPYYGGNANFVGWDLIGYPGVRMMVTADDQKMGKPVKPNHRSAYELGSFVKATASAGSHEDSHHGD